MTADFAHRLALDAIRDGDRIEIVADEPERADVAKRLGLAALDRLEANAVLQRDGLRVRAQGRLRASLQQSCVATGEPIDAHVDEAFEMLFVPEPQAIAADDEIELSAEECDTIFYEGGAIDLGTAIADSLALAVEPYPRSADSEAALRQAGVLNEEQAGPFAILAKMKGGSADS